MVASCTVMSNCIVLYLIADPMHTLIQWHCWEGHFHEGVGATQGPPLRTRPCFAVIVFLCMDEWMNNWMRGILTRVKNVICYLRKKICCQTFQRVDPYGSLQRLNRTSVCFLWGPSSVWTGADCGFLCCTASWACESVFIYVVCMCVIFAVNVCVRSSCTQSAPRHTAAHAFCKCKHPSVHTVKRSMSACRMIQNESNSNPVLFILILYGCDPTAVKLLMVHWSTHTQVCKMTSVTGRPKNAINMLKFEIWRLLVVTLKKKRYSNGLQATQTLKLLLLLVDVLIRMSQ